MENAPNLRDEVMSALGAMESLQSALNHVHENDVIGPETYEAMLPGMEAVGLLCLAYYTVIQDLKREMSLRKMEAAKTGLFNALDQLAAEGQPTFKVGDKEVTRAEFVDTMVSNVLKDANAEG